MASVFGATPGGDPSPLIVDPSGVVVPPQTPESELPEYVRIQQRAYPGGAAAWVEEHIPLGQIHLSDFALDLPDFDDLPGEIWKQVGSPVTLWSRIARATATDFDWIAINRTAFTKLRVNSADAVHYLNTNDHPYAGLIMDPSRIDHLALNYGYVAKPAQGKIKAAELLEAAADPIVLDSVRALLESLELFSPGFGRRQERVAIVRPYTHKAEARYLPLPFNPDDDGSFILFTNASGSEPLHVYADGKTPRVLRANSSCFDTIYDLARQAERQSEGYERETTRLTLLATGVTDAARALERRWRKDTSLEEKKELWTKTNSALDRWEARLSKVLVESKSEALAAIRDVRVSLGSGEPSASGKTLEGANPTGALTRLWKAFNRLGVREGEISNIEGRGTNDGRGRIQSIYSTELLFTSFHQRLSQRLDGNQESPHSVAHYITNDMSREGLGRLDLAMPDDFCVRCRPFLEFYRRIQESRASLEQAVGRQDRDRAALEITSLYETCRAQAINKYVYKIVAAISAGNADEKYLTDRIAHIRNMLEQKSPLDERCGARFAEFRAQLAGDINFIEAEASAYLKNDTTERNPKGTLTAVKLLIRSRTPEGRLLAMRNEPLYK